MRSIEPVEIDPELRDSRVQVAGIENVSRSAELRQQRRPTPWPRPTLLVHHRRSDGACARALAAVVAESEGSGTPPGTSDEAAGVWISEVPKNMRSERRHLIELWLPPASASAGI